MVVTGITIQVPTPSIEMVLLQGCEIMHPAAEAVIQILVTEIEIPVRILLIPEEIELIALEI
jgi:hypothetical protein